jgi:hypothetical protein
MHFTFRNVYFKWLTLVLVSTFTLATLLLFSIHPFLSPTQRIADTNTLVIEGWLSDDALKETLKEIQGHSYERIITTGGPLGHYYRVYIGGTLHIPIPDSLQQQSGSKPLRIEAYGSHVDKVFAHFSVWVNDSVHLGDAYTTGQLTTYEFPMDTCISFIKSLQIHFDNDKYNRTQDRDLFVGSITVSGASIPYNSGTLVYEQHWPKETKFVKVYETYAENAAAELAQLGADSTKIVVIRAPSVGNHRTYNSAVALKNYLTEHHIYSFNLVSLGVHSRRSWLSYEKALGKEYTIGIIAIENKKYHPDQWWQSKPVAKNVLREAAKYLYIRFWFDPVTEA